MDVDSPRAIARGLRLAAHRRTDKEGHEREQEKSSVTQPAPANPANALKHIRFHMQFSLYDSL